jgi:hypothetical protein
MNAKMIARRARAKASKKASKEGKKHKLADTVGTDFKVPTAATATASITSSASGSDSSPDGESAAKKAKKSTTTESAFAHQKDGKIKNGVISANGSMAPKTSKSVQDDPSKSEVYKKLFSSHKSALNQPKGHWVTFDPRYN